jgi:protein-S-isoprenylcysteine O-methyltransferase Ste14
MAQQEDAAAVRVFPPAIPLCTVLLGVALARVLPVEVPLRPSLAVRCWVGGLIVAGAVLFLGLWSVLLVRGSGQSENPWKPTTQLIERGPFRISRNPMYLQMVVGCIGFAVILWNVWILALTPLCAFLLKRLAIIREEAYLSQKFGEEYAAYRRRVRRWI